ncbi:MAG: putative transporter ATP-binding protein, partial [Acidimicrobiia bacterium]|nr:putative transporter ATP-binding protein [Acidimicrobiia bacterium]
LVIVIVHPDGASEVVARTARRLRRHVPRRPVVSGAVLPSDDIVVEPVPPRRLEIRELTVRYGAVTAVDALSVTVDPGEIVGLIGPNGAGKTTLIDAISGFAPATGSIKLGTESLDGLRPHVRTRRGLGRTFQDVGLWEDLTVEENVGVRSGSSGSSDGSGDVESTLTMLGLDAVRDRPASELSQGQRQLVSIARALVGNPRVLLLDEPAAGLDSKESLWLGERLRDIRDGGVTILLIDHDMGLVLSLCDYVQVLNFGQLIAGGPPAVVRADPAVASAYLGRTHADQAGSLS